MPVNIGVNIQRSPNRINQQLREAGVEGKFPKLLLDFKDQYYLASGGSKTLANAVTHSRSGNAVMTDGYGDELVTNGSFTTDVSSWSIQGTGVTASSLNGVATVVTDSSGQGIYQNITTEAGKTYIINWSLVDTSLSSANVTVRAYPSGDFSGSFESTEATNGYLSFTATGTDSRVYLRTNGADVTKWDNVSVREMPVLKWAPHNLLPYSEDLNSWNQQTAVTVTSNDAIAPDGTQTADKVVFTNTGGSSVVRSYISTVTGIDYVWAVWLKADANVTVGLRAFSTSITVDVTTEWQLFTLPETSDGGTIFEIRGGPVAGSTIYAWGAHLYRSDLGGMVDNPDRGDSYVPTALRPTGANLVTNGTFDTDSDWTKGTGWSIGSGVASVDGTQTAVSALAQTITVEAGSVYSFRVNIASIASGNLSLSYANGTGSVSPSAYITYTAIGQMERSFVATASGTVTFNISASSSCVGSVDNTIVRKSTVNPATAAYLPRIGHHVYNSSAWVNEGLLAESEARTNLATYSNFSSGFGNARCTRTPDAAVSPDGTQNASEVIETTDTGTHFISTNTTVTASVAYTLSCYFKQSSGSRSAILRTNNVGTTTYAVFDFATETITETGADTRNATVENVGNGWYRVSFTYTQNATTLSGIIVALSNSTTPSSGAPSYTGDGTSGFYVYGVQFEQAETPSSYVPTGSGSSVTRAAETFTIPSANLPWPSPQYIGSELVTNGTFDTDTSNWTAFLGTLSVVNSTLRVTADSAYGYAYQSFTTVVGNVYQVKATLVDAGTTGANFIQVGTNASPSSIINQNIGTTTGTYSFEFVATDTTTLVRVASGNGTGLYADWDNISVREINPLAVSIGMDGRMTYADEDSYSTSIFYRWFGDANNYLVHRIDTALTQTGHQVVQHRVNGVDDYSTGNPSNTMFSPDVLVPFDVAARHGSTFVQVASDGLSPAPNTTPTALPDLSATDLNLAHDYMGTIGTFRVWDRDITDTGLVEATNPSLEPSLSLTFEGVGTNSFVVNDWSE